MDYDVRSHYPGFQYTSQGDDVSLFSWIAYDSSRHHLPLLTVSETSNGLTPCLGSVQSLPKTKTMLISETIGD